MLPRLEYVKQARVRLGLTQRKLAGLTGISTSMINQIESGRANQARDCPENLRALKLSRRTIFDESWRYLQS